MIQVLVGQSDRSPVGYLEIRQSGSPRNSRGLKDAKPATAFLRQAQDRRSPQYGYPEDRSQHWGLELAPQGRAWQRTPCVRGRSVPIDTDSALTLPSPIVLLASECRGCSDSVCWT